MLLMHYHGQGTKGTVLAVPFCTVKNLKPAKRRKNAEYPVYYVNIIHRIYLLQCYILHIERAAA